MAKANVVLVSIADTQESPICKSKTSRQTLSFRGTHVLRPGLQTPYIENQSRSLCFEASVQASVLQLCVRPVDMSAKLGVEYPKLVAELAQSSDSFLQVLWVQMFNGQVVASHHARPMITSCPLVVIKQRCWLTQQHEKGVY